MEITSLTGVTGVTVLDIASFRVLCSVPASLDLLKSQKVIRFNILYCAWYFFTGQGENAK